MGGCFSGSPLSSESESSSVSFVVIAPSYWARAPMLHEAKSSYEGTYSNSDPSESTNMSASPMMAAPSAVMADIAAESDPPFDCCTTSRFWLLLRLYFCGDRLPALDVLPEFCLLSRRALSLGGGGGGGLDL